MFGFGISQFMGGHLEVKLGCRIASAIGAALFSGGVILTYFSIASNIWGVALTLGIILGIGNGIGFYPAMASGLKWFPDRRGMTTGCVMAGFGLGAFVFDQIQTAYINPTNLLPNAEGYFTPRNTSDVIACNKLLQTTPIAFLMLGGMYGALQIIGIILIKDPPKQDLETSGVTVQSTDSSSPEIGSRKIMQTTTNDVTVREAVRTRAFYVMLLTFLINNAPMGYISAVFKNYGLTQNMDDQWLARVGAVGSLFNGFGKFAWGFASDKLNYKVCLSIISLSLAVLLLTLQFMTNSVMYGIWIWALNIMFAGTFVVMPSYCVKTFGFTYTPVIYGIVQSGLAVVGVIDAVLTEYIYPLVLYNGMFYILAGFSMLAFLLTLLYTLPDKRCQTVYKLNTIKTVVG